MGGNDNVGGGDGNDNIAAGGGANTVDGGVGNDTIGSTTGADLITGGDGNDTVDSGAGTDTVGGNAGADTIHAGAGQDVIFGGTGNDVFTFSSADSTSTIGTQDQIRDWDSTDQLQFQNGGTATDTTTYVEIVGPSDYHTGGAGGVDTLVNSAFGAGANYVVMQVGADVVIFVDNGTVGGANTLDANDDVVVLTGRTLADISAANFV